MKTLSLQADPFPAVIVVRGTAITTIRRRSTAQERKEWERREREKKKDDGGEKEEICDKIKPKSDNPMCARCA